MGFILGFLGTYACKVCKETKEVRDFQTDENINNLRTPENYNQDVLLNDKKATGVVENSIWNSWEYSHVTRNYSVDPRHDLSEGVDHYDVAHVLSKLISEGLISLDVLNARLAAFPFEGSYNCF